MKPTTSTGSRRRALVSTAGAMLASAAIAGISGNVHGATYTFNRSGNAAWFQSGNWSPSGTPGITDIAVFPAIMSAGQYDPINVTLANATEVSELQIDTHGVFNLGGPVGSSLNVGAVSDFVNQSGVPANHVITVPTFSAYGAVDVGVNGNLTVTGRCVGSGLIKGGPGTLWLTNPSNTVADVQVRDGTLAVTGDVLPFQSWNTPLAIHSGATLRVAADTTISRPLRGPFDGDSHTAPSVISVDAGHTATFATSYWGFHSLDITGGGTAHLPGVEFTPLQGHPTDFTLGITGGSTLVLDNCLGSPTIILDGGTLVAGASFYNTGAVLVKPSSSSNSIDTRGRRFDVDRIYASAPGAVFNATGGGMLNANAVTGVSTVNVNGGGSLIAGQLDGVTTANVNGSLLWAALGNTRTLNLNSGATWIDSTETTAAALTVSGSAGIVANSGTVTLNGPGISGSGQLSTRGAGTLRLQNATPSGFNGTIAVTQGRTEFQSAGLLNVSGLTVASGATAAILAPNQFNPYVLPDVHGTVELNTPTLGTSPVTPTFGFQLSDGGTLYAKRAIDTGATRLLYLADGTASVGADPGATFTISGSIRGTGVLHKVGAGDVVLTSQNVYDGPTVVESGRLVLAHPRDAYGHTLANGSTVVVESPGTLRLGATAGQNNVIGTGENPANIASLELYGTLDSAAGTTHNLGTLNLRGGVVLGTATPAPGYADYTLNSTVTVNPGFGESYILAPGGVNLRNQITFDVAPATAGLSELLRVDAVIGNEPGTIGALRKTNSGAMLMTAANGYTGGTTVENGTLVVGSSGRIAPGALTVTGGATAFETGNLSVQRVASLNISGTGAVDLNDNDMIVGPTTPSAAVAGYVRSARHGGLWDSPGLTSGAAKVNPARSTTLAVLSAAEYRRLRGASADFDGVAVGDNDTLVKYTYNGDANLDGRVTFDDYVKIDTGFNTHLGGWLNGDFNYDGIVNFDDYVLIDIAFNQQNGTLARAIDWISGDDRSESGRSSIGVSTVIGHADEFGVSYGGAFLAAVPEPVSVAWAALAALPLLGRHRRPGR